MTDRGARPRPASIGRYLSASSSEECRPAVLLLEDVEQWFPGESQVRTDRLISGQVQRWFVRQWDAAVTEARLPEGSGPAGGPLPAYCWWQPPVMQQHWIQPSGHGLILK